MWIEGKEAARMTIEGAMDMTIHHVGMVRITEPHFGTLLKYLVIEIIKDIYAFFKDWAKGLFK